MQTKVFDDETTIKRTVPREVIKTLQMRLDDRVEQILDIPNSLRIITRDFMEYRYQFNKGKRTGTAANQPDDEQLFIYARTLSHSLDIFVGSDSKKHEVKLARLQEAIMCQVTLVRQVRLSNQCYLNLMSKMQIAYKLCGNH